MKYVVVDDSGMKRRVYTEKIKGFLKEKGYSVKMIEDSIVEIGSGIDSSWEEVVLKKAKDLREGDERIHFFFDRKLDYPFTGREFANGDFLLRDLIEEGIVKTGDCISCISSDFAVQYREIVSVVSGEKESEEEAERIQKQINEDMKEMSSMNPWKTKIGGIMIFSNLCDTKEILEESFVAEEGLEAKIEVDNTHGVEKLG